MISIYVVSGSMITVASFSEQDEYSTVRHFEREKKHVCQLVVFHLFVLFCF